MRKNYRFIIKYFLLTIFFATMFAEPSFANSNYNQILDGDDEIEVKADKLSVERDNKSILFSGNAKVVKGGVTLSSNKIYVYYKDKDKQDNKKNGNKNNNQNSSGLNNSIEKIEAVGNVIIATDKENAYGDKALFMLDERKIYLYDNVVLEKGKSNIRGSELIYNIDSGIMNMKPLQGQQIKAVINKEENH